MTTESMWDKLRRVDERFEEIGRELSSPDIQNDPARIQKLSREHKELTEVVATYRAHEKAREELAGAKDLFQSAADDDMVAMAQEEAKMLEAELSGLRERLKFLLLPKDPNDDKNVILEIRAGTGGDEAGIFVGDLFRMYTRYAEGRGWRVELLSSSDATAGGYKEVIAMITGEAAFSRLKFERGVHRVQRVPKTEASGRIHTSTITVAVLPEAEDVDIDIKETDLRIDVYRAGGHGGQSVNTTDSAVRITHLPTGMVVAMQDEKSQLKNKVKGMKILRSRLLEYEQRKADEARQSERRGQVGTGERSEKIRTYNYPQSRVSDHRIGLTLHSLFEVVEGDLDEIIDALTQHYQAEALGQSGLDVEQ